MGLYVSLRLSGSHRMGATLFNALAHGSYSIDSAGHTIRSGDLARTSRSSFALAVRRYLLPEDHGYPQ